MSTELRLIDLQEERHLEFKGNETRWHC